MQPPDPLQPLHRLRVRLAQVRALHQHPDRRLAAQLLHPARLQPPDQGLGIEQGALLKTTDGGASWRELGSFSKADDEVYKDVHRLLLRPSNPDELFLVPA